MDAINARLSLLQTLGRSEHFDSEGGGRIVRSIYCEPYTSHKRVATALRGTVYNAGGGDWGRKLPHADPLYPWFFCQDVQVEPAFPGASRAARNMRYDPAAADQFTEIQRALSTVDDFDAAELLDNLVPAEIAAGGLTVGADVADSMTLNTGEEIEIGSFNSRGKCGARITATYLPLLFQPGISAGVEPFDYVDPQWEPLTFTTQTGRSLFFFSPSNGFLGPVTHGGLSDAYAMPEVVWRFSIRRLMVPFLPSVTVNKLTNKLNTGTFRLGNLSFPPGTVRMETPEVLTRRAPDGNIYFDILYKFLVRQLYDEYYDPVAQAWRQGWVGWNWHYGMPSANFTDIVHNYRAGYYPVCWNGGLFQLFGTNHPLFLSDSDMGLLLDFHPFTKGFKAGE